MCARKDYIQYSIYYINKIILILFAFSDVHKIHNESIWFEKGLMIKNSVN